jgi:hypothetical protein
MIFFICLEKLVKCIPKKKSKIFQFVLSPSGKELGTQKKPWTRYFNTTTGRDANFSSKWQNASVPLFLSHQISTFLIKKLPD